MEVIHNFLGGFVVRVALWLQCGYASSVFGPFVLPEGLVVAFVVLPVRAHVIEQVRLAKALDDG